MKRNELKPGYAIFGNKGNVWSNQCHIFKVGFASTTLCGTPMLSSNWAKIEEVEEAKCPECLKKYSEI